MRKRFRNQRGTMYEKHILALFIGCTAAVVVPAFVEGNYLRGSLCLTLATTPFLYFAWQHFQAWREEKKSAGPPDPP